MSAESLARKLGGRWSGSQAMAPCPAHEDANPSLAITERGGRTLVKCHAGCSQQAVIDALKALGLWESTSSESPKRDRRIAATYNYTDQEGKLLYQVCRTEPKSFFQRYPDGRGGWVNKKHPRQVLYRLREVLENPIIFVCEGEKDCETLHDHGFVATCEAGGASVAWQPQFTEALRGREVILIPDLDPPGRARCVRIGKALLGNVVRLRCFDDHGRVGCKDITEWFERGYSECEFIALLEGVNVV
jgi:putative DNA primase/helicase